MINDVIRELHSAILAASRDYFTWSHGHIFYDKGAESVMQVYSAKMLFDFFSQENEVSVHLERSRAELVQGLSGRIDMTLELKSGPLYAIEFKRLSGDALIAPDLARLREIVSHGNAIGLLAIPCYMKQQEQDYDWPLRQKRAMEARNVGQLWHLSEPQKLPEPGHKNGWSHERALVIQVLAASQFGASENMVG